MALKILITKVEHEKLPDVLKTEYKENGDNFILDTDDSNFKIKLDEFRTNNRSLMNKEKELLAEIKAFDGIDPVKAKEAATRLLELEDQQLKDEGKMDELLEVRTERMQADFTNRYEALETANKNLEERAINSETQLHGKMVEAKIAAAVNAAGSVMKGAMPDILTRARSVWQLDKELNLIAMKGGQPILGVDGKANITPEEYAKQLTQEAAFFFEGSSGSGGSGNENKGNGTGGKTIIAGDRQGFGNNLADIAAGKVQVTGL